MSEPAVSGMLAPMTHLVGLSGGIGSGKSTVSSLLEELGSVVIDADAIVHELQAPGTPLLAELVEAFGPRVLTADGALDRKTLGGIVFEDPGARAELGRLVHPRVGETMLQRSEAARAAGAELVVLDIPLLFEGRAAGTGTAAQLGYDSTLLVWVPVEVQIERTIARDACSRDEAQARIDAQLPIDEKRALADRVIDNSGTREQTRAQVERVHAELTGT
ncbi:MAG: dephospho-CoA kinase [Myxococcota bacterium]|nr:dephospho-CoA kinase [Myxococcota bacterium]